MNETSKDPEISILDSYLQVIRENYERGNSEDRAKIRHGLDFVISNQPLMLNNVGYSISPFNRQRAKEIREKLRL